MYENIRQGNSNGTSVPGASETRMNSDQPFETDSLRNGRTTGVLLLLGAVGTVARSVLGRFALGLSEDSGGQSFAAYRQHPLPIFLTFGAGMIAGLLFILAAPLLYLHLARSGTPLLRLAAVCQALAGLVLAMSASRWLIVLPFLQKQYDQADSITRAAINVDYDTISYFFGITLGEHLFAILTGLGTLFVSIHLLRVRSQKLWVGWLGLIAGAGWLLGSLEQLDFGISQYFIIFLAGGPIIWLIWTAFLAREFISRPAREE